MKVCKYNVKKKTTFYWFLLYYKRDLKQIEKNPELIPYKMLISHNPEK